MESAALQMHIRAGVCRFKYLECGTPRLRSPNCNPLTASEASWMKQAFKVSLQCPRRHTSIIGSSPVVLSGRTQHGPESATTFERGASGVSSRTAGTGNAANDELSEANGRRNGVSRR